MRIVDDQQSVLVSLDCLLGLAGYRVLTALSGSAAIALAEAESIDGALIDIHMPIMDGFQVAERLRAVSMAQDPPLRIWFMSGALCAQLRRRTVEAGAVAAFAKPFDLTTLCQRFEDAFSAPVASIPSTPNLSGTDDSEGEL